ncbi:uncharacterized protein F5147DRAFT_653679 [Suillus discolor]|uniref:Uncharacterized protein n=1 Tax=Suillus discolor TaxID=1912936 RepID=A0A9P7F3Z6_9AGAM|nr:uncharacterized protein F5147DRAFT_653679 [Suillus discolor]KAG2106706.1 hypothetical protein F5147DRAFT_653679 [Suillus discolor]
MPSTSTINMFEDNILIEINGVASTWDTYCLGLNIVTPGSKISERPFERAHLTPAISSTNMSTLEADNIKTEPDLVETCVKFEEDDKDSINSVFSKERVSMQPTRSTLW